MHVVTEDERRRAVSELREMSVWDDEVDCTDFGERVSNLLYRVLECDGTEGDFYAALADLIDPDTTSDTTKTAADTTKCDREALLALADELDETAWRGKVSDGWTASVLLTINRYTDRIREACGEVDE